MKPCVAPVAMPAIAMPSMSRKGSPSISMRSANVPLSPSSALQTTYFCAAFASATVRHLMPVEIPRRRGREVRTLRHFFDDGHRRRWTARCSSAGQPPMSAVVGQRQRIDDAATRESQPRLPLEPGMVVERSESTGGAGCLRESLPRKARARRGPNRSIGDASSGCSTSTTGSSQKSPREPVRMISTTRRVSGLAAIRRPPRRHRQRAPLHRAV